MDRSLLKRRAREVISSSNPRVILVGLVYLLLCAVVELLSSNVLSVNISESEAMNYLNYFMNGNYDYALKYIDSMKPPASAYAINALLILPAAAARNISRTARQHAAFSVLIGLVSGVAGLVAAYYLSTGVGAAVVLCAAVIYAVTLPMKKRTR